MDLSAIVSQYPILATVLMAIGVFRLVFKPLMTFIHAVVAATPTPADDAAVAQFEAGPIYKALAWFVDFAFSIKLPGQK
jgi:hypothetical protein